MRVYGIVGFRNAGKTGLMVRLVSEFTARGLTVSTIKHAHHAVDVDKPGKDSFRHRQAGATQVILASQARWALMSELRDMPEPALPDLLGKLSPVDLVLVEGYKRDDHPKIEVFRKDAGHDLLAGEEPTIRAVASDIPLPGCPKPVFDLDDTQAIAAFIASELGL